MIINVKNSALRISPRSLQMVRWKKALSEAYDENTENGLVEQKPFNDKNSKYMSPHQFFIHQNSSHSRIIYLFIYDFFYQIVSCAAAGELRYALSNEHCFKLYDRVSSLK